MKSTLIYALGGGRGHATRAGRVAAELAKSGTRVRVLVAEGRADLAKSGGVEVREIDNQSEPAALRRRVEAELDEVAADHLIVDALPRGVLGELHGLPRRVPRTLLLRLHRELPALTSYDRVIDLEPQLEWFQGGIAAGPVAPAVHAPSAITDVLLVASDDALARFFGKLGRRLTRRGLEVEIARGDAGLFAARPRVLVGPAGYNLSYEALAHGVPHLALPRPRRFDDQARRAREVAETCDDPLRLEARIAEIVVRHEPRKVGVHCKSYAELALSIMSKDSSPAPMLPRNPQRSW